MLFLCCRRQLAARLMWLHGCCKLATWQLAASNSNEAALRTFCST